MKQKTTSKEETTGNKKVKKKHTGKGEMCESHVGEGDKTEQTKMSLVGRINLTTLVMVTSAATEVTETAKNLCSA